MCIYKIKLGVNNGQVCWERRYQLENLGELGWQCGDGPIYTTIFRAFQRRIGKKNSSTTGETCLRKWGNPVYAHDPDNPFVIAGMESLSIYPRAVDQFPVDVQDGSANMLKIEKHSGIERFNTKKRICSKYIE